MAMIRNSGPFMNSEITVLRFKQNLFLSVIEFFGKITFLRLWDWWINFGNLPKNLPENLKG